MFTEQRELKIVYASVMEGKPLDPMKYWIWNTVIQIDIEASCTCLLAELEENSVNLITAFSRIH